MHKRKKHPSTPLENDNSHDISSTQKSHYEQMGYKPYLSYKGKIKWLSYEQHIYERIKYAQNRRSHKIRKGHSYRRRRTSLPVRIFRAVIENWVLIIIFIIILLLLKQYNSIVYYISTLNI
jgi:hypothetical protein